MVPCLAPYVLDRLQVPSVLVSDKQQQKWMDDEFMKLINLLETSSLDLTIQIVKCTEIFVSAPNNETLTKHVYGNN